MTEYHAKGTLDEHLRRYAGQPLAALRAFRGLVEGVAKIHATKLPDAEENLVHRDIKLENIFVADNGRLVLGDMGLVYIDRTDHTRVTSVAMKIGTLAYLPSWQLPAQRDKPDQQQDVFALGKILWERNKTPNFFQGHGKSRQKWQWG